MHQPPPGNLAYYVDYQETETAEGVQRSYMEETFDHLPHWQKSRRLLMNGITGR